MSYWTDDQEEKLKAMWGKEPTPKIAAAVGKSGNAIIGKAHKMSLPPITAEQRYKWAAESLRKTKL